MRVLGRGLYSIVWSRSAAIRLVGTLADSLDSFRVLSEVCKHGCLRGPEAPLLLASRARPWITMKVAQSHLGKFCLLVSFVQLWLFTIHILFTSVHNCTAEPYAFILPSRCPLLICMPYVWRSSTGTNVGKTNSSSCCKRG